MCTVQDCQKLERKLQLNKITVNAEEEDVRVFAEH